MGLHYLRDELLRSRIELFALLTGNFLGPRLMLALLADFLLKQDDYLLVIVIDT